MAHLGEIRSHLPHSCSSAPNLKYVNSSSLIFFPGWESNNRAGNSSNYLIGQRKLPFCYFGCSLEIRAILNILLIGNESSIQYFKHCKWIQNRVFHPPQDIKALHVLQVRHSRECSTDHSLDDNLLIPTSEFITWTRCERVLSFSSRSARL